MSQIEKPKNGRKIASVLVSVITVVGISYACAALKSDEAFDPKRDQNPQAKTIRKEIIRSTYAEGEITSLCDAGLSKLTERLNTEVKNALDLDWVLADASDEVGALVFMAYVHTNGKIRDEASACEEKYNKANVDIFTRRDLYKAVSESTGATAGERRLIAELKRRFDKNGMALDEGNLEKLKSLRSELATLEAQFSKNLNEDTTTVLFAEEELAGVPAETLARLKRQGDKLVATTKSTDFLQVMENASNPEARRRMLAAYDNRAPANTALLEKAISLRQEVAKLMGYKTWADYQTDGRMAQNAERPLKLISDLKGKLRPRLEADLAILLKAKKEMEDPNATELKAWDIRYYPNQVKKRDYSLDNEVIREYFPKDVVMEGMFNLYSTLFNVRYEEVKDAVVWTPEVKMYAIREKADDTIIGYFYADFIPREGKYGHAAAFPLVAGRMMKEGHYSQPVASIVSNFSPPAGGKPSLLTHDEVETLFHEFGHIMHQTLTAAPYAYLSGSSTAQDFVEAPSQMLEGWVWDADQLNKISGHHTDPSKKLPAELVQKMLAAKDFNQGYHYSRQVMLGLTDLEMHMTDGPVNVTETYNRVHTDVLLFAPIEGSHFVAGFGHMMGGYDAGYYGYIWSEVFAADMFTKFEQGGLENEELGRRYRDIILGLGAMEEPLDLLTNFLGRAPNDEAFLKKLGL